MQALATERAKVRILNFRYHPEKTCCLMTPFQILTSQDTGVLCGLVQTHSHEENNSKWANGVIFTSKDDTCAHWKAESRVYEYIEKIIMSKRN